MRIANVAKGFLTLTHLTRSGGRMRKGGRLHRRQLTD